MADLAPLKWGRVRGRFLASVGDTDDPLEAPDAVPMTGYVLFGSTAPAWRVITAQPDPATLFPAGIQCVIGADGYLYWNNQPYIDLVSNLDNALNPVGAQWKASFYLKYPDGSDAPYPTFAFDLPEYTGNPATIVDLTTVAPVATPSPGTIITAGPPGPQNLFIQATQPSYPDEYLWIKTNVAGVPGNFAFMIEDGN